MNKREKELFRYTLDNEAAVIKALEKNYRDALEDISTSIRIMQADELTQSKVYQMQYQQALKKQVEGILERLHAKEYTTIQQYLSDSYTNGFVGSMYSMAGQGIPIIASIDQAAAVKAVITDSQISEGLYDHLGIGVAKMKKAIRAELTRGIASNMRFDDIARNISFTTKAPLDNAKNIVSTEGHRIQQASADDARHAAADRGADMLKQWDATMDGNTRPIHRQLDGKIVELNEYFEAGGKKARYPGDFGDPALDCRCRCVCLDRPRWALGEEELQTLKDRAAFFGLDKAADFEDYKNKYLKAAETVENAGESGIISKGRIAIPERKLTGYALDPEKAPDKAKAFKLALGYDQSNADELMQNIIDHVDENKLVEKGDAGYGMLYQSVIQLTGPNGKQANVMTAWIDENGKKRLTSVYVTNKKVTE